MDIMDKNGLINLTLGFGISGAGGGGSFQQSVELVKNMLNSGFDDVKLGDINDLGKNDVAVVNAGIGKPSELTNVEVFAERCLRVLDMYNRKLGETNDKTLKGIAAGEAGPINGLLPLAVAHSSKGVYKVYDCDGAGRAVPSLTDTMYDELVSFAPFTYSWKMDAKDDTKDIVTYQDVSDHDLMTANAAEEFLGNVMQIGEGANGAIPFACWGIERDTKKDFPTMTYQIRSEQGNYLRNLMPKKEDISEVQAELLRYAPGAEQKDYRNLNYQSTLCHVERIPHPRWTCGWITFDKKEDEEKRIYFVNEFSVLVKVTKVKKTKKVKDNNTFEVLATDPSIIYMLVWDENPSDDIQELFKIEKGGKMEKMGKGWFPYNSGDLDTIKRLKGSDVFVGVIGATPNNDQKPYLMTKKAHNFIENIQVTFGELRKIKKAEGGSYENEFPASDQLTQIVPNPYDVKVPRGTYDPLLAKKRFSLIW